MKERRRFLSPGVELAFNRLSAEGAVGWGEVLRRTEGVESVAENAREPAKKDRVSIVGRESKRCWDGLEVRDGTNQHLRRVRPAACLRGEDGVDFGIRRCKIVLIEERWQTKDEAEEAVHHEGGPEGLPALPFNFCVGGEGGGAVETEEEGQTPGSAEGEPGGLVAGKPKEEVRLGVLRRSGSPIKGVEGVNARSQDANAR